jgi:hypothetical protein
MENVLPVDQNGNPIQIMSLSASHDIDGTSVSAASHAIMGETVRIVSLDNIIRFVIGENPVALIDSAAIPALSEIWHPIVPGQKVAIIGGKANIATAGA